MSKHELLKLRSLVVRAIRAYFDEQGFLEVHTPRLVGLPGQEPYLEPMWSNVHEANGRKHRGALITSPEYAMKKLLGSGLDKIYDLGPCFRDSEPWDGTHDPEFLMIEWYRRDAGLEELMHDTEGMINHVVSHVGVDGVHPFPVSGEGARHAPLRKPFRRLSVRDAMKQYANIDLDALLDNREAMATIAREHDQTVTDADSWDDLFFKVFLTKVEPYLGWSENKTEYQPTFLHTYPASMAALARKDPSDPRYALRTELYIGDLELANGFAELCDPIEQRTRFEEEKALRASLGKDTWSIDERFMSSLPGMGNAAGIAFGVDRLAMLIGNIKSISDLMPVPVHERFENETL